MNNLIRKMFAAFLVIGVMAGGTSVFADGHGTDYTWYISPLATFTDDDEDRLAEDELTGGALIIGWPLSSKTSIELNLNANNMHLTSGGGLIQTKGFNIDLMRQLGSGEVFTPYVLAGGGYLRTDRQGATGREQDMTAAGAVGLLGWIDRKQGSAVRAEARLRGVVGSPQYSDVLYSLGFQTGLGSKAPPPPADSDGDGVNDDNDRCPGTPVGAAVGADGCELDADGDGVVNSKDRCPNTKAGARVDARGCEIKPKKDTDGDGVTDDKDACPSTPRGAKVDARGCELDDDGDGVVNSQDRCPNTASGVRVDVYGCEIKGKIDLPGVQFELNSAVLRSESHQILNDAAQTLQNNPGITVEVAGHTDSSGADTYNMSLSEKRAASVKAYLMGRGVDSARMTSRGYGETSPIADNGSKEGRAINRRVELTITGGM